MIHIRTLKQVRFADFKSFLSLVCAVWRLPAPGCGRRADNNHEERTWLTPPRPGRRLLLQRIHLFAIVGRASGPARYRRRDQSRVLDVEERAAGRGSALVNCSIRRSVVPARHGGPCRRGPERRGLAAPPDTPTDGLRTDGFRIIGRRCQPVIHGRTRSRSPRCTPYGAARGHDAAHRLAGQRRRRGRLRGRSLTARPAIPRRILLATSRLPWFEQLAAAN